MAQIHVDENALKALKNSLEGAGENYKINLTRLQNLMNEITSGDIQGDPATDLLNKFQSKESMFKGIASTIDEAEEYMGIQTTKFTTMISDLSSSMR